MRTLHWFRADLRRADNRALSEACRGAAGLAPVFVLDERLLGHAGAPRARFLADCLARLASDLEEAGCPLIVRRGDPATELVRLVNEHGIERVTWNRDGSPYARRRDDAVQAALETRGVRVTTHKDRVVFEGGEVRTKQGTPYTVFTPFRNAWRARLEDEPQEPERASRLPAPIPGIPAGEVPSAASLGHGDDRTRIPTGGERAARRRLLRFLEEPVRHYEKLRDVPAEDGTSRLSPYLRFGAISPRLCLGAALEAARDPKLRAGAHKWIDELVWRDFYAAILEAFPHVLQRSFRREYDGVRWNDDEKGFAAWREGRTGYPIVDAGMRQLRETGWMHNRVRMIAASFLVKDLLLDWRRGERFFFDRLVDGDPASNNGGWQWAASTGTDAQPWFRIFNPTTQGERHDPDGRYVRRWVPELRHVADGFVHRPTEAESPPRGYPEPIVEHASRRIEALRRYEAVKGGGRRGLRRGGR